MSLFKDVNVIQYLVVDWEKTRKFYMDILDWPVVYRDDEMGWIEFGEEGKTHLALNRWNETDALPTRNGGAIAVLTVEDAAATVTALRARGVRCDDVLTIPGVVVIGAFYDPEGNQVQFASLPPGVPAG